MIWCETNDCENPDCHRCFPRDGCIAHEKCEDYTRFSQILPLGRDDRD